MKKVILCILDGVGLSNDTKGNAFKLCNTPNIDFLMKEFNFSKLEASGIKVGLPENIMGNSEVGHINIGAGRIVYQSLELINQTIKQDKLKEKQELNNLIKHVNANDSNIHLMGLLSDGGVHSHINHLFKLIEDIRIKTDKPIYIHAITDGRDTLMDSSIKYLDLLNDKISNYKNVFIATIVGRFYAMDRDNRYERIKLAYDLSVFGIGTKINNYKSIIKQNYKNKIYDEFLPPYILKEEGIINDNDGFLWFNFRKDRAREILTSITNNEFSKFKTKKFKNLFSLSMFDVNDDVKTKVLFIPEILNNTMGEVLSNNGFKQLRIAETEKYAHVTYFFDGGIKKDLQNCDTIMINSPKVKTYDMKPEMSAIELTKKLLNQIDLQIYDFILVNYANGDMVGHTGNLDAAISAVDTLDKCVKQLYNHAINNDYTLIITADHGNCEQMLDNKGNIITSHSTNKVPFIICDKFYTTKNGNLSDISPTIIKIMDLEKIKEMSGKELI
ncbi:MAG: 2,3-bisphosphoglycerate-independent phosphoglycerate mutase [Bacilli bacterium]